MYLPSFAGKVHKCLFCRNLLYVLTLHLHSLQFRPVSRYYIIPTSEEWCSFILMFSLKTSKHAYVYIKCVFLDSCMKCPSSFLFCIYCCSCAMKCGEPGSLWNMLKTYFMNWLMSSFPCCLGRWLWLLMFSAAVMHQLFLTCGTDEKVYSKGTVDCTVDS